MALLLRLSDFSIIYFAFALAVAYREIVLVVEGFSKYKCALDVDFFWGAKQDRHPADFLPYAAELRDYLFCGI
jgi:hypothetical protein